LNCVGSGHARPQLTQKRYLPGRNMWNAMQYPKARSQGFWRLPRTLLALLAVSACNTTTPSAPPPGPPPGTPTAPALYDRIIFTRGTPPGCTTDCVFGLWTITPTGADLRLLRDSLHYPAGPAVAPDGRTIVFEDWGGLYLMDGAGQNLRQLGTGLIDNHTPTWTPDGDWILFMARTSLTEPWQIHRIHPDGSGREQLTTDSTLHSRYPVLSRDGRYLAYVTLTAQVAPMNPEGWLVIRDMVTGTEQVVTDSSFYGVHGQWSPDASALLFLDSDPHFPPGWALWRFTRATRDYSYFGNSQGNRPATYSPDGRTLLYGTGVLWLADSSGQNPRVLLADSAQNFEAFWTPASPTAPRVFR